MDLRSTIILILACVLLLLWYPLMNRIYPRTPVSPTNIVATALTNGPSPAVPLPRPELRPGVASSGFTPPSGEESLLTLENDVARYVFTAHGGGIKGVELKNFPEAISCRDRKSDQNPGPAIMNKRARAPLLALLGVGPDGEYTHRLTSIEDGVRAEMDLGSGLVVVKEFRPGTNYLLRASTRIENRSNEPRAVPAHQWVLGTAAPLHTNDNVMYLGVYHYDGSRTEHISESWFANRFMGCFPGTPRDDYLSPKTNTVWAAVHNQFFTTTIIPKDPAAWLVAQRLDLTRNNGAPDPMPGKTPLYGYQAGLTYPAVTIPPQQALTRDFDLYIGPKEYNTLARLGHNLDVVMGFDSYFGGRFSGFFARGLLLAMNGFHKLGLSYALSIIAITVIVRLIFWPLTQTAARASKRMAALQPQVQAIQQKYKEEPQKMQQKMLELWRENKVNPASGCLPILIQFPILLGFYAMLQTAIELRGASFLWACDLSQSDTIALLPGLGFPINPLPLLMGVTMLWQARLTPLSPGMDPVQQKMLKYMPLMFMVFLYNFSAGLTLYWTVSNLLSIAQMKLTRAIDQKEKTKVGDRAVAPPAPAAGAPTRAPKKARAAGKPGAR